MIDNTEKVKQATKWLHSGKTPRKMEEIVEEPEPDLPEQSEKTISIGDL